MKKADLTGKFNVNARSHNTVQKEFIKEKRNEDRLADMNSDEEFVSEDEIEQRRAEKQAHQKEVEEEKEQAAAEAEKAAKEAEELRQKGEDKENDETGDTIEEKAAEIFKCGEGKGAFMQKLGKKNQAKFRGALKEKTREKCATGFAEVDFLRRTDKTVAELVKTDGPVQFACEGIFDEISLRKCFPDMGCQSKYFQSRRFQIKYFLSKDEIPVVQIVKCML